MVKNDETNRGCLLFFPLSSLKVSEDRPLKTFIFKIHCSHHPDLKILKTSTRLQRVKNQNQNRNATLGLKERWRFSQTGEEDERERRATGKEGGEIVGEEGIERETMGARGTSRHANWSEAVLTTCTPFTNPCISSSTHKQ